LNAARDAAVALASGVALALAFPEPDIAPLAWVALAPVLVVAGGGGARRGALVGFAFGAGFFGLLLYWISIVGVLAWALLVLLQSLFAAAFGALWGMRKPDASVVQIVVVPAVLWVGVVEYVRAALPLLGFTWGQLAQSQHNVPFVLESAGVAGSWGVAFVLVIVNGLVAQSVISRKEPRRAATFVTAAAAVLGLVALVPAATPTGAEITAAVIQGNVPNEAPSYQKDRDILSSHRHLTEELPQKVDLVVWPESAIGIDPFRDPEVGEEVSAAARSIGRPMIVGGNLDRDDDHYQVMAYLISPTGEFADSYQKTHLVPFGEFVPARRYLDWIPALDQVPRDAVPGKVGKVFDVAGGKVATVISFEADFGSLVRARIAEGGRLLVVATNTSTWLRSWASAQHVALSQVRAAENGVYVLHAALSGISAVIEPDGTIVERTQLWEADRIVQDVRFAENVTLYARTGDWLPIGCLVGGAGWFIWGVATRRRTGNVER